MLVSSSVNWLRFFRFSGMRDWCEAGLNRIGKGALLLALILPGAGLAAENLRPAGNAIDFSPSHDGYFLTATLDYELTDTAKDALQKGIPLFWDVLIKLKQQRKWLWDRTLVTVKLRYRIQYQALLNRYRVTRVGSAESDSFATLAAALNDLATIRHLLVIDKERLKPDARYQIGIKIEFDREALPLPLRPVSYFNPQWYLSSDWYLWPVRQ